MNFADKSLNFFVFLLKIDLEKALRRVESPCIMVGKLKYAGRKTAQVPRKKNLDKT